MAQCKVKMKASMEGPAVSVTPGDEHECSEADALRLLARGMASKIPGVKYPDWSESEWAAARDGRVQTKRIDQFPPDSPVACLEAKCHVEPVPQGKRPPVPAGKKSWEPPPVKEVPFIG
jgi:hypothetical protein